MSTDKFERKTDPLRVLLIDDNPQFAYVPFEEVQKQLEIAGRAPIPTDVARTVAEAQRLVPGIWARDDHRLSSCFSVQLIESAQAAKTFRELSLRLDYVQPELLGSLGVVPEIILIDYDLSQNTNTRESVADIWRWVSPLPALRDTLQRLGLSEEVDVTDLPNSEGPFDRTGCFVGGLLATTFASHPCVPIPTTSKGDAHVGYDGRFFEWLLKEQFFDAWKDRGQTPQMRDVLAKGVKNLRMRIGALVKAGLVIPSLEDLLALSKASELESVSLRVQSRYGVRAYPAAGLFVDETVEVAPTAANEWATTLLADSLHEETEHFQVDYQQAKELSERLYEKYVSDDFVDRHRLSELYGRADLTSNDSEELARLTVKFGVTGGSAAECTKRIVSFDETDTQYSDRARRWGALFVMVKVAKDIVEAGKAWRTKRGGKPGNGKLSAALSSNAIDWVDVCLALFPCPSKPVNLSSATLGDFHRKLMRLGRKIDRSGNTCDLALKLSDVLAGESWDRNRKRWGVSAVERTLLQMHALDMGFTDRSAWPAFLTGKNEMVNG